MIPLSIVDPFVDGKSENSRAYGFPHQNLKEERASEELHRFGHVFRAECIIRFGRPK